MSATWLTGAWLSPWRLPWAVVVEKSEIFWKTMEKECLDRFFFRSRHGGDFVGLTSKLPYIKGLGCEAVWISPIFQNGNNSYHQFLRLQAEECCHGWISDSCWHFLKIFGVLRYAMLDFTLLDKRLGTLQELRDLINAAHNLGMYVIVDVLISGSSLRTDFWTFSMNSNLIDKLFGDREGLANFVWFWFWSTIFVRWLWITWAMSSTSRDIRADKLPGGFTKRMVSVSMNWNSGRSQGEFLLFFLERLVGTWRVLTCKSTFFLNKFAEEMMLDVMIEAMGAWVF